MHVKILISYDIGTTRFPALDQSTSNCWESIGFDL
jgi:hypothetical protein